MSLQKIVALGLGAGAALSSLIAFAAPPLVDCGFGDNTPPCTSVPEPSTLLLVLGAVAAAGAARKFRRGK